MIKVTLVIVINTFIFQQIQKIMWKEMRKILMINHFHYDYTTEKKHSLFSLHYLLILLSVMDVLASICTKLGSPEPLIKGEVRFNMTLYLVFIWAYTENVFSHMYITENCNKTTMVCLPALCSYFLYLAKVYYWDKLETNFQSMIIGDFSQVSFFICAQYLWWESHIIKGIIVIITWYGYSQKVMHRPLLKHLC